MIVNCRIWRLLILEFLFSGSIFVIEVVFRGIVYCDFSDGVNGDLGCGCFCSWSIW